MESKNVTYSSKKALSIMILALLVSGFLNFGGVREWVKTLSFVPLSLALEKPTAWVESELQVAGVLSIRQKVRDFYMKALEGEANAEELAEADEIAERGPAATAPVEEIAPVVAQVASAKEGVLTNSPAAAAAAPAGPVGKRIVPEATTQASVRSEPGRVLILGDSMLKTGLQVHLKQRLRHHLSENDIIIFSQVGTGLSRPEVFDWTKYLQELKGNFKTIFVFLGTNDAQNFALNKKVVLFGSEAWDQEYGVRMKQFLDYACKKAEKVYWLGLVQMKPPKFNKRMERLNQIFENVTDDIDCAEYIDTSNWLDENGKYTETATLQKKNGTKKVVKLRADDGIHLSFWGAEIFVDKLYDEVKTDLPGVTRAGDEKF